MPRIPKRIVRVWEQLEKSFGQQDLRISAVPAVLKDAWFSWDVYGFGTAANDSGKEPDVAMRRLLMHKFRKEVFRVGNNFTE